MNREIKFRGKRLDNSGWLYGYLREIWGESESNFVIAPAKRFEACGYTDMDEDYVDSDTIGQFTGLHDKNGKEIYEGDILKWDKYETSKHFQIEYNHGGFGYWYYGEFYLLGGNPNFSFKPFNKDKDFKVIGNIYDNPELLNI